MHTITPVIHRQLDRCDTCGDPKHKKDLVRTQVDTLYPESQNQFDYSDYDGTYWKSGDSTIAGDNDGIGTRANENRLVVANDNTLASFVDVPTVDGSGIYYHDDNDNRSGWSYGVFSAVVAPHHRSTSPTLTVILTIDPNGVSSATTRTWVINNQTRVWVYSSDIKEWTTGGQFKIDVTAATDKDWLAMDMQLEKDVLVPGEFLRTTGTATTHSVDTRVTTTRKVCERCFEVILKRSTAVGRPYIEVEPEIQNQAQEF